MGKHMIDQTTGEVRERHATPFADVLRSLRRGLTHDELTEALADLVEAVQSTGKKGTLTFTVSVEKLDRYAALNLSDDIKVKLPREADKTAMFGLDGRLTRDDPLQPKLPLGLVDDAREVAE